MAGGRASNWLVRMDRRHRYVFFVLVVSVVAAVFIVSAYRFPSCPDAECFMSYANFCGTASYVNKISTMTVLYETKDCLLRKTILEVDPAESEAMRELLTGKSMVCSYLRNDFSALHLTRISAHLSNCEGSLKDAISRLAYSSSQE